MSSIAIIGAGLSGLTLAHQLSPFAHVTVFEKSRGFGGRMATRHAEHYSFDHGAQFFIAKTPAFAEFAEQMRARGVLARWYPRFVEFEGNRVMLTRQWDDENPHYVAVPAMNRLGAVLAQGLQVRTQTLVSAVQRGADGWVLQDAQGESLGAFDWVVVAAPPASCAAVMPAEFAHNEQLHATHMLGCYALMLGFAQAPALEWEAALVREADISWISVNSSKPGRDAQHATVLVHATNAWAEANMARPLDEVRTHMCEQLRWVSGVDVGAADHCDVHRWRYANIPKAYGAPALLDTSQQLAACGDWCVQGRVEAAYTSAMALAEQMRALLR